MHRSCLQLHVPQQLLLLLPSCHPGGFPCGASPHIEVLTRTPHPSLLAALQYEPQQAHASAIATLSLSCHRGLHLSTAHDARKAQHRHMFLGAEIPCGLCQHCNIARCYTAALPGVILQCYIARGGWLHAGAARECSVGIVKATQRKECGRLATDGKTLTVARAGAHL